MRAVFSSVTCKEAHILLGTVQLAKISVKTGHQEPQARRPPATCSAREAGCWPACNKRRQRGGGGSWRPHLSLSLWVHPGAGAFASPRWLTRARARTPRGLTLSLPMVPQLHGQVPRRTCVQGGAAPAMECSRGAPDGPRLQGVSSASGPQMSLTPGLTLQHGAPVLGGEVISTRVTGV